MLTYPALELYTDESPGLKVDPFVVMVLSIGFIISVVALHSTFMMFFSYVQNKANNAQSYRESDQALLFVASNQWNMACLAVAWSSWVCRGV